VPVCYCESKLFPCAWWANILPPGYISRQFCAFVWPFIGYNISISLSILIIIFTINTSAFNVMHTQSTAGIYENTHIFAFYLIFQGCMIWIQDFVYASKCSTPALHPHPWCLILMSVCLPLEYAVHIVYSSCRNSPSRHSLKVKP
jgi:hypothetical protein